LSITPERYRVWRRVPGRFTAIRSAGGMRRTRRGGVGRVGVASSAPNRSITIEDLIAAKKLATHLGSVGAASQVLSALARLS